MLKSQDDLQEAIRQNALEVFECNLIDAARNLNHSREEPMKEIVHSVVLTAGAAMDGFENKLKKEFMLGSLAS